MTASPAEDRAWARTLSDDDWQAHTTKAAAQAIGRWLEARGHLDQPIRTFTMIDLEAMATAAIGRWVVLSSYRLKERRHHEPPLAWLLET